jgi:glycosyltransferase involved in cell wall biosynthesis
MKIAYASADFGIQVFGGKGASVHIQEMLKAFVDHGCHVDVVSPQLGDVPAGFNATAHRVTTVPPAVTEADLALAKDGDRVFKERRNLAAAASVERELLQLHAAKSFDFIYERYSLWSAAGVRAARKLGMPIVLEVNAPLLLEQGKYRKLMLSEEAEAIERECFENADLIFAVSEEIRTYVISKGAPHDRTFAQPNGVDLTRFSPVGPVAGMIDTHLPVIGFSGSLRPWHGLEDLLRAFQLLREHSRACHLLIVGEGPLRGWIDGYVEAANLQNHVTVTGWVPHDQIPAYIRRMDIATAPYPAIDEFYFSPLKLFEYMACGRAVIASDIGQIAQVIRHGENGMLYTPGRPTELALKIERLLINSDLRQKLGEAARISMDGASWHDCAGRILEAVHGLPHSQLKRLAS